MIYTVVLTDKWLLYSGKAPESWSVWFYCLTKQLLSKHSLRKKILSNRKYSTSTLVFIHQAILRCELLNLVMTQSRTRRISNGEKMDFSTQFSVWFRVLEVFRSLPAPQISSFGPSHRKSPSKIWVGKPYKSYLPEHTTPRQACSTFVLIGIRDISRTQIRTCLGILRT